MNTGNRDKKEIRILDFSPFYPPHVGGVERYAEELHENLAQKGCRITAFVPCLPQDAKKIEEKNGVFIIRYPAFEIIYNFPIPCFWKKEFWRQWNMASHNHFDLVISTSRFFVQPTMAILYAKIKKIPILHIEHGSDFIKSTPFISFVARIFDYTLGRLAMVKADRIITPSLSAARFVKILSGKKTSIIYRGMPFSEIDAVAPREDLREKFKNKKIVAYIGRLIYGKGLIHLLEAVKSLKRDDIIVFIVGDGGEMKNLTEYVKKNGLSEKVVFFGNVPFKEGMGIMKIIDIFAHPSYNEGLPTSVLEAGVCKIAIVATNVGGTPEIITHNNSGIIIKPYNSRAVADALEELLDNPEKRKMFGENARKEIEERFNWDVSINAYLKEINSIIKDDSMSMKKKVLHVITGLEVGGAEMNLLKIIPALEKQFDNLVCCIGKTGTLSEEFSKKSIAVEYLNISRFIDFFNPLALLKFRKIIKKFKPDILETYLIHADLYGRIWGRLFGVKKIICNHRGSLLQWEWLSFFDKLTSFLVTKYVFQTPSAQKEISKKLNIDFEKTTVIPNVINLATFQFEIDKNKKKRELGINNENINITNGGANLKKIKGIKYLIKAFNDAYVSGYKNINLLVIGYGDQRPILEDQARVCEAKNNIFFLGKRKDVLEILKISDILVLPTLAEGMSNTIMEAMASKLPVITTNINVNQDLVTDSYSGLLIPVKNSQAIRNNLIKLLENPQERARLGENAFKEIQEKYSLDVVIPKIINLLKMI